MLVVARIKSLAGFEISPVKTRVNVAIFVMQSFKKCSFLVFHLQRHTSRYNSMTIGRFFINAVTDVQVFR